MGIGVGSELNIPLPTFYLIFSSNNKFAAIHNVYKLNQIKVRDHYLLWCSTKKNQPKLPKIFVA